YELTPQVFVLALNRMQATDRMKEAVDAAMEKLRAGRYPVFVLDLRRDGGGASVVGTWVLQHLARGPFRYADEKDVRISPLLAEGNERYRGWIDELKAQYPVQGDRVVMRVGADDGEQPASDWTYDGNVYLLTSPRTYS